LARALIKLERSQEAEATLAYAEKEFSSVVPDVLAETAYMAEARGDTQEALKRWTEVMARYPNNWLGYRGKISLLLKLEHYAEADSLIGQHARMFPDEPLAVIELGKFAERRKDWAGAETAWRSFINLEGSAAWGHVRLIESLKAQRKLEMAERTLQEALERFPNDRGIANLARLSDVALRAGPRGAL
jgi:tetratricopeptide (TPR) repeat protein